MSQSWEIWHLFAAMWSQATVSPTLNLPSCGPARLLSVKHHGAPPCPHPSWRGRLLRQGQGQCWLPPGPQVPYTSYRLWAFVQHSFLIASFCRAPPEARPGRQAWGCFMTFIVCRLPNNLSFLNKCHPNFLFLGGDVCGEPSSPTKDQTCAPCSGRAES